MWWKLLVVLLLLGAFLGEREVNSTIVITKYNTRGIDTTTAFRAWSSYFAEEGIAFSDIVTAQCFLETDFLSSQIYEENFNLFGMKYRAPKNGKKHLYAEGERYDHAYYLNRYKSVQHYNAYQKNMLFLAKKQGRYPTNNEEYFALLEDLPHCRGCRYATDPLYVSKLRNIIATYKDL